MLPEEDDYVGGLWIQQELDIDHHIPFEKNGRMICGNLVSLCKKCNSKKGANHPETFYDSDEIEGLMPFLKAQELIIPKSYYWDSETLWTFRGQSNDERFDTLIGEGINPELARCALKNENHRYYCGKVEGLTATMTVTVVAE